MPQRIVLPRICIALGFPEVERLLAHARSEYDAGERFFEFRLDYIPSPEQGIAAMRKFLAGVICCSRPECRSGLYSLASASPSGFRRAMRSEEHTSELQSRFGISYAVFCLKKK